MLRIKKNIEAVKKDLRLLHRVPYPFEGAFDFLAVLVMRKWDHMKETKLSAYFKKTWTLDRKQWSRCHMFPGDPSTNNGQERKNRVLKELQNKKRLPLQSYFPMVFDVLRKQSADVLNVRTAPDALVITQKMWREVQVRHSAYLYSHNLQPQL